MPKPRGLNQAPLSMYTQFSRVRCSWGRFPSGVPGMSSLISCHEGQLSRPSFSCSPMRCSGPKASEGATNIGNPPCEEGSYVEHGSACTPHCAHGFGAMVLGPPDFDNCEK
eukprot:g9394.t1